MKNKQNIEEIVKDSDFPIEIRDRAGKRLKDVERYCAQHWDEVKAKVKFEYFLKICYGLNYDDLQPWQREDFRLKLKEIGI